MSSSGPQPVSKPVASCLCLPSLRLYFPAAQIQEAGSKKSPAGKPSHRWLAVSSLCISRMSPKVHPAIFNYAPHTDTLRQTFWYRRDWNVSCFHVCEYTLEITCSLRPAVKSGEWTQIFPSWWHSARIRMHVVESERKPVWGSELSGWMCHRKDFSHRRTGFDPHVKPGVIFDCFKEVVIWPQTISSPKPNQVG